MTYLVALLHVPDQSPQLFHVHLTVGHVHMVSLCCISGGWVHLCGRPSQECCCTVVCSVLMVLCLDELLDKKKLTSILEFKLLENVFVSTARMRR